MAPLRRYLRISPYSTLEVRIHLTDPYQAAWLPTVLPRITAAIKPHVFRQLREERARATNASSKRKKVIKDVAVEEDFEVSVFLTEGGTRHSLLVKTKGFGTGRAKGVKRRRAKAGKLTGWLEKEKAVDLTGEAVEIREESDEEDAAAGLAQYEEVSDDEGYARTQASAGEGEEDDKKKLDLDLSYDGFAIYGKVLCLVVKRRGAGARRKGAGPSASSTAATEAGSGRAMLETWVSTQVQAQADGEGTLIED